MNPALIVELTVHGLEMIAEITKLLTDVHSGKAEPIDAMKKLGELHERIKTDRATADEELRKRFAAPSGSPHRTPVLGEKIYFEGLRTPDDMQAPAQAATVTHVWSNSLVNLKIEADGVEHTSVPWGSGPYTWSWG